MKLCCFDKFLKNNFPNYLFNTSYIKKLLQNKKLSQYSADYSKTRLFQNKGHHDICNSDRFLDHKILKFVWPCVNSVFDSHNSRLVFVFWSVYGAKYSGMNQVKFVEDSL